MVVFSAAAAVERHFEFESPWSHRLARQVHGKAARHAEMHDQSFAAIQVDKEILSPPAEAFYSPAFQPRGELSWKGNSQISPTEVDSNKPPAGENG